MTLHPIPFFRACPMTQDTLCSEPVVAWAVARGRLDVPREDQERAWRVLGTEAAAAMIAGEMGLAEIAPADVAEGDAVLLRGAGGEFVLGVNAGAWSVAAQGGRVHVGRFAISRAWSLR